MTSHLQLRTANCLTVCGGAFGCKNVYDTPHMACYSLTKHLAESPEKIFITHLNEPTDATFQHSLQRLLSVLKIKHENAPTPVLLFIQCDCNPLREKCLCIKCLSKKSQALKCNNPGAFYYFPTKNHYTKMRAMLQNSIGQETVVVKKYCANPGCFNVSTSKCSGCQSACYCNVTCQKAHWKNGHKPACKKTYI